MRDMNGRTIAQGDTIQSVDTNGISEGTTYKVAQLGVFENSEIIIHPIYNGRECFNLARYLNSFFAGLYYRVVTQEEHHENI